MLTPRQLLLLILLTLALSKDQLKITAVSDRARNSNSYIQSSVSGGKKVYIFIEGHSKSAKDISVTIGSYPCIFTSDMIHEDFIVCSTSACTNKNDYEVHLSLTVKSKGKTATSSKLIYYSIHSTPTTTELFPTSTYASQPIAVAATHMSNSFNRDQEDSSDSSDAEIKIEDTVCALNNVTRNQVWGWDRNEKVNCKTDQDLEAGKYKLREKNKAYGDSDTSAAKKSTLNQNQTFHFTALPAITNVTSSGNEDGHQLTIQGFGFSKNLNNNTATVNGQACKVTESSSLQLKCTLGQKDDNITAKIPTNTTQNQSSGYISGAGLNYTKYNGVYHGDIFTFIKDHRSSSLGAPAERSMKTQLKSSDSTGSYIGQVWSGYFKAPAAGTYTFRGMANYSFALFFSNVHGSKEVPEKPLIYSNYSQTNWDNFFYDNQRTAAAAIELLQNQYYYIQAYHLSYYTNGKFKISVEVPNNNTKLDNQAHQVHQIVLNATHQPEVMTYSMTNSTAGIINLKIMRVDPNTLRATTIQANVTYGCTWDEFTNALRQFDCFQNLTVWGYYTYSNNITGNRTIYDSAGKVTTDLSSAARIDYTVSFYQIRSAACQAQRFTLTYYNNYKGKLTQSQTTKHSSLINGTFGIKIGGVSLNSKVPYNVDQAAFQSYFKAFPGLSGVQIDRTYNISCDYGCRWTIAYKGYLGKVPDITFSPNGLSGGVTSPAVYNTILRNYSTHVVFSQVDNSFLYTADEKPNVVVQVNQIQAVCLTNCTYSFQKIFKIVNISLIGSKLRILLANFTDLASFPALPGVALGQVRIQAGDINCSVIASESNLTGLNISCQLPTNYDGSPRLPAGNLTFRAFIPTIGYIGLGSGVLPVIVPFLPTGLLIPNGTTNGGYQNSITGSGFPANNQSIELISLSGFNSELSITICGNPVHITFISNKAITFVMPACSASGIYPLNITYGNFNFNNLSFTYIAANTSFPKVSSIFPTSSNPMVKSTLEIIGSNFGSNLSAVNIYLSNSSGRVYQLKPITINNTYIKCGLPGGLPGNYTLQLNYPFTTGLAFVNASGVDHFAYATQIHFVYPNSGSIFGGTLLTIVGKNFSPASSDTLVYIGYTLNWFCNIQSINETMITCLTPLISGAYSPGELLDVVVSTKLTEFSPCSGSNCLFSYQNITQSPNVTNLTITYNSWGAVVAASGYNFTNSYGCSFRFRAKLNGKVTTLPALSCVDYMANITLPSNISAGIYYVSIVNSIGDSNPQQLNIKWLAGNLTLSVGSTEGSYNYLSGGSSYPPSLDSNYKIDIVSSQLLPQNAQVLQCCGNNSVKLYFPPAPSGTLFTLTFTYELTAITMTYSISSSFTPQLSIISPTNLTLSPGSNAFRISTNSSAATAPNNITFVSTINSSDVVIVSNWAGNSSSTNFTASLPSGSYKLQVNSSYGYYLSTSIINVTANTVNTSNQNISFAGGSYTILGSSLSPSSYLTLNGQKANIVQYTSTAVTYQIPPFVTVNTQSQFNLAANDLIDSSKYKIFSDLNSTTNILSFDGLISTSYASGNAQCWIGLDFGSLFTANISRIRFYPNNYWSNAGSYLLTAQFQGSNDQSNWTTMATIDSSVHSAWNIILPTTNTPFRYVRFLHNTTSSCQLAELQFYGIVYNIMNASLTSQYTGLVYSDGYSSFNLSSFLYFRSDRTPIVTSVSPQYGDIFGGYNVTLTGSNLGFASNVIIKIDDIFCLHISSNNSQIICQAGARPNLPAKNSFSVTLDGNNAILKAQFLYVLKWSDDRTWGVDLPPIDNDLVFVPAGMTLLVDKSTPNLAGIAVQNGTIIFSDNATITVTTAFITVVGGRFIAGTEQQPLNSSLTFVLTGGYYDAQQPIGGNKMIFCLECKFSMYGKPRTVWTTLAATISPNSQVLRVSQDVDWQVGEKIVVASTSYNHYEAQTRTIVAVTGRNVTVDSPFLNTHLSANQVYNISGEQILLMQAEVALLSRNIKIRGDSSSTISKYGAHLMLSGESLNGFEGKVAYSEFTLCGQPQIPGRHCIYFHMNGETPTSYARGNAVYQSFARVVAIKNSHFITVQNNVGYRAAGHNFLLQDGIETNNVFQNNLAISSLSVKNMMQSDIMVSSFMIRHPTNYFIGNRAAGSDYYGFHFQLPDAPIGSAASRDICPSGSPLGSFTNNLAHSNRYHGFRINNHVARTHPCSPAKDEYQPNSLWQRNPSIQTLMSNFTSYKNLLNGFLAQKAGNYLLNNFTVAENLVAGIQINVANYTKQYIQIKNSVIIARTNSNPQNVSRYANTAGLVTPRTGSTNITGLAFYYFPNGSNAFVTCAQCDNSKYFTNVGTEIFVKGIKFYYLVGRYLWMQGVKRDIIYDSDGSFSFYFNVVNRTQTTITYAFNHITAANPFHCTQPTNASFWDTLTLCDSSVTIRRVMITNAIGSSYYYNFYYATMYVSAITDETVSASSLNSSSITFVDSYSNMLGFPAIDKPNSWSLPYVAGTKYLVWWSTSDDFSHISLTTTPLYQQSDSGIVFKFAYTTSRELYSIGPMRAYAFPSATALKSFSPDYLEASSCLNGDYYHNNTDRELEVCQSGKNKTVYEYTEVNAIFCKYLCPPPVVAVTACDSSLNEKFMRYWSNASIWPNNTLPKAGDNVTIPCNWNVMLDRNPEPIGILILDGTLYVDDTFDVNITANFIHIRSGTLNVGTNGSPFQHKFTIQLNGNRNDAAYQVDSFVYGNKFLVVSGALSLNGIKPDTLITHLSQTAVSGTTLLYVGALGGWKVGHQLSLSPSFTKANQYEIVTITSINANGSLTVDPPLKYTHYGASSQTITHEYGTLDTRTNVGHLTRNIKIVNGGDQSWGFSVFVYGYNDGNKRVGNGVFNGVQFISGGQDSQSPRAALHFINLKSSLANSLVTGSSFQQCYSSCIEVQNTAKLEISTNVFYQVAYKGVNLASTTEFTFSNNLIVGVGYACFSTYNYAPNSDAIMVRNNVCQGSQGYGFIFPHIKCDQLAINPFAYNTAGSCSVGFLFNQIQDECQAFSYISAYACSIGQLANPSDTTTLLYSNFILADNKLGATLRFGNNQPTNNNSAYFQNSYITALSRPTCSVCYDTTFCRQVVGLRMLAVTASGHTFQDLGPFDAIIDDEQLDAKAYLTNITFDSFRQNYSTTDFSGQIAQLCGNNFAMQTHPQAVDATGGHYLFTCNCSNCDQNSYIYCDANSPQYLGLAGGCGDILCTGKSNYIVIDWNGTFFDNGNGTTLLPNNTLMGENQANCTFDSTMNGHLCQRDDFVVLEYQSKAPDYNSRIMWPVNLTANTSNYTTVVNGWKEWNWQGSTPSGTRLGRFVSVVKLYSIYNITFSSTPPLQLHFQLQKTSPSGNNSRWTIVKLYYPLPNSIEVSVGGTPLAPIIMTNTEGTGLRRALNVSQCGDNIFFFSNRTIAFVVTQDPACMVSITLSDSIQLTTHFAMNASDFFSNTVMSSFISNLCALLNIRDQSRVKVVGVYAGSAIVDVYIAANGSASAAAGADPAQQTIANALAQAINDGTFSSSMANVVGYQVIIATSSFSILPVFSTPTASITQSSASGSTANQQTTLAASDPKFIIGIIAGATVVAIAVIIVMCYLYKKQKAAQEEIANHHEEKEMEEKEQSHAIVVSGDVLFENDSYIQPTDISPIPSPKKKQNRNRRVRQRQAMDVIEFD